jgi:hypothetical protein
MKKLALVLAIAMIALFSAPVYAELNIGGSYRLTATDYDPGHNVGVNAVDQQYFQQRFRLPFTFTVNDNITGFIRTDWTEERHWGTGNLGGSTDTIYVDYAWVKISQPMFDLIVGMQEVLLGNWSAFDSDQEGITLALKFDPITVTLAYGKLSENGANTDAGANDDADSYGAEVRYAADGFTVGALYAKAVDDAAGVNTEVIGYGLFATVAMDIFTIKGEVDFFDGEASPTVDFGGMNIWVDAKAALSEALTLGAAIYYGEGNNSATETQVSSVAATGGSFLLFDFLGALAYDEGCYKWGTTAMQDGFDMSATADAGIIAFKLYGSFKATDAITLHGVLGYAEPDENVTLNSETYVIGSIDYAWMPNVTLSAGAAYISPDYSGTQNDDAEVELLARLGVNF